MPSSSSAAAIRPKPFQAIEKLKPCTGYDTPVDAYCGSLKVYENRATKQGRQIDLNIVVLPALRSDAAPDPLFFLAGGPGQGAAKLAKVVREIFRRVQSDRDIVLVDQRGTGKSNPLDCNSDDDSLQAIMETNEQVLDRLKACQAKYDADLTLYTTPIAMDDLDDVRAFLGYDKINVYGGSYGTRAALVYMRQHGDRVRSAILDGVAPTNMRLPLYFPRDTQRALRAARQGLRGRRRLQQGVSEPGRAHEGADRSAREESADGEGDASTDRRDRRHQDRRAPARERDRDGALLADHDDPRAGHRRRRGEERLSEHAGPRGHAAAATSRT